MKDVSDVHLVTLSSFHSCGPREDAHHEPAGQGYQGDVSRLGKEIKFGSKELPRILDNIGEEERPPNCRRSQNN